LLYLIDKHRFEVVTNYHDALKHLTDQSLKQLSFKPNPIIESLIYLRRPPQSLAGLNFLANSLLANSGKQHLKDRQQLNTCWNKYAIGSLHENVSASVQQSLEYIEQQLIATTQKKLHIDLLNDCIFDHLIQIIAHVFFGQAIIASEIQLLKNAIGNVINLFAQVDVNDTLRLAHGIQNLRYIGVSMALKSFIRQGPLKQFDTRTMIRALRGLTQMNRLAMKIAARPNCDGYLGYQIQKTSKKDLAKAFSFYNFSMIAMMHSGSNAIAQTLRNLLHRPECHSLIAQGPNSADQAYARLAVLESIRLSPPLRYAIRLKQTNANNSHSMDGYLIDLEQVSRDPKVYGEDAPDFDLTRELKHNVKLLAFGAGVHNCMGREIILQSSVGLIQGVLRNFKIAHSAELQAQPQLPQDQTSTGYNFFNSVNTLPVIITQHHAGEFSSLGEPQKTSQLL